MPKESYWDYKTQIISPKGTLKLNLQNNSLQIFVVKGECHPVWIDKLTLSVCYLYY